MTVTLLIHMLIPSFNAYVIILDQSPSDVPTERAVLIQA
jgi:hypothetical protein